MTSSPLHLSSISLERIFESITLGLVYVDNEGVILYANAAFCDNLGYTKTELHGKIAHDFLVPPKERELIIGKISERLQEISGEYEISLLHKNGEVEKYSMKGYPVKDETGKIIGSVGVHADITRAELQKTHQRLETLVANMKEVFFSYDLIDDKYLFFSASCEDVYGYTWEEFMNNNYLWQEVIHPDDKHIVLAGPPYSEGKSFNCEYRIIRKDKTICWVESRIKPTLDENGIPFRLDGIVSDITLRKIAEQKLEQKVNELNIFTYKASHDLRAPLASLIGLVTIAAQESKDDKMQKYFQMIGESTRKMDALLKELTAVATITQGEPQSVEIDFKTLIEEVVSSIKFLPGCENIKMTTDLEVERPFFTDKRYLHSVLSNLVSNAVKYADPDKKSFAHIAVKDDPKGIRIEISDNGIGIPDEYQEKVFEMFYRATEKSFGSGLGLYIVNTTIEKLHGKIEMKSKEGEGTTFSIVLPNL